MPHMQNDAIQLTLILNNVKIYTFKTQDKTSWALNYLNNTKFKQCKSSVIYAKQGRKQCKFAAIENENR